MLSKPVGFRFKLYVKQNDCFYIPYSDGNFQALKMAELHHKSIVYTTHA